MVSDLATLFSLKMKKLREDQKLYLQKKTRNKFYLYKLSLKYFITYFFLSFTPYFTFDTV